MSLHLCHSISTNKLHPKPVGRTYMFMILKVVSRRPAGAKWSEVKVMSDSLRPYSPWNSPRQNSGVGSCSHLQRIFPTQGLNPDLQPRSPTLQVDSLPAEPRGSPTILEWVAYPFSSGSSQPRNQTRVSCIAGGFFTNWATREAPLEPNVAANSTKD